MPEIYQPADIKTLIGVHPDVLRDWRRRKLIDDCGVYLLPGGGWTKNSDDPRLAVLGRPTWGYLRGDVVRLALVRNLAAFGFDLATAFAVAALALPHVAAWLDPAGIDAFRHPRFLVAWPVDEGDNPTGSTGLLDAIRLDDLNKLPDHAGAKAIVIDLPRLAASLPQKLRDLYSEDAGK